MKLRIFTMMLACCLMAAAVFPAAAEEEVTARSLIERIVVSYAADRIRDEKALSVLSSVDSPLGEKWARIMDLWEAPVPVNDSLPDSAAQTSPRTETVSRIAIIAKRMNALFCMFLSLLLISCYPARRLSSHFRSKGCQGQSRDFQELFSERNSDNCNAPEQTENRILHRYRKSQKDQPDNIRNQ